MKKLIFILTIAFVISGFYIFRTTRDAGNTIEAVPPPVLVDEVSEADGLTSIAAAPEISQPIILEIPVLSVSAEVEYVGMDETGRMDVPKNDDNVAWWMLGVKPGQNGNAVMAGHFDRKNGGPAVFYELDKLQAGDEITVTDENNNTLIFEVYKTEQYKDASFPIETVFGPSESANLNLITCDGVFDSINKNYSDRLVVFSRLKS